MRRRVFDLQVSERMRCIRSSVSGMRRLVRMISQLARELAYEVAYGIVHALRYVAYGVVHALR